MNIPVLIGVAVMPVLVACTGPANSTAVEGHVSTRYRSRFTDGDDRQDIYTTLYADVGDSQKDPWTLHMLGTLRATLTGSTSEESSLFGLDDTFDGALQGRIYDAYADYRDEDAIERLRIGRQFDHETPTLAWFDGVSLRLRGRGDRQISGGIYGGVPVHTYESSSHGDGLVGVWGQAYPWSGGRVRLDYMHIKDEHESIDRVDDLLSLAAWQSLGPGLQLEGDYSRLDGEERDVRVAASWLADEQELIVRLSVYRLLATQRQRVIELDPFYESLLELVPYTQARVLVSRSFTDTWNLEGGVDLRRVDDDEQVGQFNRNFDRVFATVSVFRGLPLNLEGSFTADSYHSSGNDVRSLGAELTRRLGERGEATLGTYYSLFTYDLFQNEERDNVRIWFARFRREQSQRRTLDLRYEFENSDQGEFHTLRIGLKWQF